MEKFDNDLEEIKSKYNNIKLTDEEKNNLKIKMQEELNKSKEKTKNIIFPRRLVATFACFFLVIVSCAAFADEIGDFVTNVFSNTDRKLEQAIANGNYEEIHMDYIEQDGIGIKVDYIIKEDDTLSVSLNVKCEEEFDKLYFNEIELIDKNNEVYKINYNTINGFEFFLFDKKIDKFNNIYILNINPIDAKKVSILKINEMYLMNNFDALKKCENIEIEI